MKKLVCLFMLFALGCPVLAEIQPPQWSEFCPSEYANAEYMSRKGLNPFVGMLLACSIVGSPIAFADLNKQNKVSTNNYWVERRHKFERRMAECKNITDPNELTYRYLTERQIQASNDSELRDEALATQQNAIAAQQRIQNCNAQAQINNIQNQNRFNQINHNLYNY